MKKAGIVLSCVLLGAVILQSATCVTAKVKSKPDIGRQIDEHDNRKK